MTLFEAIAEPNRRRILDLLRAGERPAGDLVEATGLSQPGVSKHLKMLREAGLVSARPDGQRRLYRLEADELAELGIARLRTTLGPDAAELVDRPGWQAVMR